MSVELPYPMSLPLIKSGGASDFGRFFCFAILFVEISFSVRYSECSERFLISVEKRPHNSVFLNSCRQAVLGF